MAMCAVLAGARSFVAITEWAHDLPAEAAAALGIGARRPCESTIRRIVQSVDGDGFDVVISTWIHDRCAVARAAAGAVGDWWRVIAVDGKALRGARTAGGQPRHLLVAIDHHARVVLGQLDVGTVALSVRSTRTDPLARLEATKRASNARFVTVFQGA